LGNYFKGGGFGRGGEKKRGKNPSKPLLYPRWIAAKYWSIELGKRGKKEKKKKDAGSNGGFFSFSCRRKGMRKKKKEKKKKNKELRRHSRLPCVHAGEEVERDREKGGKNRAAPHQSEGKKRNRDVARLVEPEVNPGRKRTKSCFSSDQGEKRKRGGGKKKKGKRGPDFLFR